MSECVNTEETIYSTAEGACQEEAGQWVWLVDSIHTFSLYTRRSLPGVRGHSRTFAIPSAPALAKKGLEGWQVTLKMASS